MRNKFGLLIILFGAYFSFLLIVQWAAAKIWNFDVILYDSIVLGSITSIIFMMISIIFFKNCFSRMENFLILVLLFQFSIFYAIMGPTVIDRSLSIYLLEEVESNGGSVRKEAIPDIIKIDYITEHQVATVRLTEQLESGTLILDADCVYLTERGRFIVAFAKFYRRHFLPTDRLLGGQYSSDLINASDKFEPFGNYSCR